MYHYAKDQAHKSMKMLLRKRFYVVRWCLLSLLGSYGQKRAVLVQGKEDTY